MENKTTSGQKSSLGLITYVAGRTVAVILVVGALLWGINMAVDRVDLPPYQPPTIQLETPPVEAIEETTPDDEAVTGMSPEPQVASAPPAIQEVEKPMAESTRPVVTEESPVAQEMESAEASHEVSAQAPDAKMTAVTAEPSGSQAPVSPTPDIQHRPAIPVETDHAPPPMAEAAQPVGVALVDAIIEPLGYELNDRFWGWRPNDIINITDNVNNFQLGVLEVTRRAMVELARRISRTGSTDAFDPNLENAMSWIMTKATDYWFPSPETKYKESLEELKTYKANLLNGNANFYTRADNLIPLFEAFEDLLGSCDQNLVKQTEPDGTRVGTFAADDYFYYAKGVAHAMTIILEGVRIDFAKIMENRRSSELLYHAIESCRRAAEMEPWIVTNADLDGILANHRANMAAPISHARYYLGQLIMALST